MRVSFLPKRKQQARLEETKFLMKYETIETSIICSMGTGTTFLTGMHLDALTIATPLVARIIN